MSRRTRYNIHIGQSNTRIVVLPVSNDPPLNNGSGECKLHWRRKVKMYSALAFAFYDEETGEM